MKSMKIVSTVNGFLYICTELLQDWLKKMLPRISDNWWQECVIDRLSYNQRMIAEEKNITNLREFDLASLLRIADRNWYAMREFAYLPTKERECIREMVCVRNNWAHCSGELLDKDSIISDLETIVEFLEQRGGAQADIQNVQAFLTSIGSMYINRENTQDDLSKPVVKNVGEIKEKSLVCMTAHPEEKGVVLSIDTIGATTKYEVFIDGMIPMRTLLFQQTAIYRSS